MGKREEDEVTLLGTAKAVARPMINAKFFAILLIFAGTICLLNMEFFESFVYTRGSRVKIEALRNALKSGNDPSLPKVEKKTNKWIVVTSVSLPTEDVKRLASYADWTLVVVGDTKTPKEWEYKDVHFLSVEAQQKLGFGIVDQLPFKSYTRKNIGYLYAILNGAEWIYDTDDDNKPYGKGLDQFEYDDTISGIRYQDYDDKDSNLSQRLFNPYRFFGNTEMWPRGFPLEFISEHEHHPDFFRLCRTMRRPAVQQGLVHKDPDVDAIYRLLNADPETGLDEYFNKFAPAVTMAPGTYSPWNSQNTLFHKSAFHTLFLPTTVAFRATDIWRSFFAQKILHLAGESVSFVPVNAIQIRNAHSFLKDFEDELEVYSKAGQIIEFLSKWNCSASAMQQCVQELALEFANRGFWAKEDADLIELWIQDLDAIGYAWPKIYFAESEYRLEEDSVRLKNCRRMNLELLLDIPKEDNKPALTRAQEKINDWGEIKEWCEKSGKKYPDLDFPSPEELAQEHLDHPALKETINTVLILTNNYRWKFGMGYLQRFFGQFFGTLIFCGPYANETYNPDNADGNFLPPKRPLNFVHMSEPEMKDGYYGYYCLTKVHEMKLQNVKGYFLVADDTVFNFFNPLDLNHAWQGHRNPGGGPWWPRPVGIGAANTAVKLLNETYKDRTDVQTMLQQYQNGLTANNYAFENKMVRNPLEHIPLYDGWVVSDWAYLPQTNMTYFHTITEIFFEAEFFHELVFSKLLYTLPHKMLGERMIYMWGDRGSWAKYYNNTIVAEHPVKLSMTNNMDVRKIYCDKFITTFHSHLFGANITVTVSG